MNPVVLDFESFYSDDFALSKMTTESYIRDPRFEAHGAAVKWSPNHNAKWYPEKELRHVLAEHDWSDSFLICHHFQFDGLILSHHYGVQPAKRGCTLSMARLMLGNHIGVSLDSVRTHFGIPLKKTPYHRFRGFHWREMAADVQQEVADGCEDEVESIYEIFCTLMQQGFPVEELETIDVTMAMFTQPVLKANVDLLARIWEREAQQRQTRLQALNLDVSSLRSDTKFIELLQAEGVEVEYKDGKNGPIPAFAKSDPFMEALLEHEDDYIRGLAEARINAESTTVQTRAATLGWMASRGPLCVYLKMYAAHTTRWGGGDRSNFQNLKKSDPDFPDDDPLKLTDAIEAPDGYYLAKPDESQIECRLVNFLAGQEDKIEDFRQGRDPYVGVASQFFGYQVNAKEHPKERQLGKIVELQAGFGSGGEKIRNTVRVKSKGKILLTPAEGLKARDAYRDTHPAVVAYWKEGGRMLKVLANGGEEEWGPMRIRDHRIWLPNQCPLIYDTLEWHVDEDGDKYWRLRSRKGWVKTYGAKIVENVVQALARVIISQTMIRIARLGYRIVSTEHDSLWILIPKGEQAQQHLNACKHEMVRPLPWLPGIPLACEGELK